MADEQQGKTHEPLIVAAIDFGTTFSGYAFSFRNDFKKDPLKIFANQWSKGASPTISMKTPSCVLFRPNEKFHSFGFDAEEKYSDLVMDEYYREWFYFRRFKMHLYNSQGLNRQTIIKDDTGKPMKAMRVFSESIRFLKDHLITTCERRFGLEQNDVFWVLTVPAIWGDAAKQFMREAAELAGIKASSLLLALEPEAASLFCKHIPIEKAGQGTDSTMECFRPGSKYLILDAGGGHVCFIDGIANSADPDQRMYRLIWIDTGGTVDITVHEVLPDGNLKELLSANGGPWGGTTIDDAFLGMLTNIAGEKVMTAFQKKHAYDYMDMMQEFEGIKRTIKPDISKSMRFKLPVEFHDELKHVKRITLKDAIEERPDYSGKMKIVHDKVVAEPSLMKDLFKSTCGTIVTHVRNVLAEQCAMGIESILMVGGFSESPMLQDAIEQTFIDKKVIIPNEAGLAVLKGAVIFGYLPHVIAARVCPYSYGIRMCEDFVDGVHPVERKCIIDGEAKCRGLFYKLAEVDQTMSVYDKMPGIDCVPATKEATEVSLKVFASPHKNPQFVDDTGCTLLGQLDVQCIDGTGKRTPVFVRMVFGGTELEVRATVKATGETTSATFDLLR